MAVFDISKLHNKSNFDFDLFNNSELRKRAAESIDVQPQNPASDPSEYEDFTTVDMDESILMGIMNSIKRSSRK